jgi:hypothetical protein
VPGQALNDALRTKDAKGNVVPDKAAIAKKVDDVYPVQPPSAPGWTVKGLSKAKKQTLWYDENTDKMAWKASQTGDTYPGPQITEGKKAIPNNSIKCP